MSGGVFAAAQIFSWVDNKKVGRGCFSRLKMLLLAGNITVIDSRVNDVFNNFLLAVIRFETITDHLEAQRLWEIFSPHNQLGDEWYFRYAFFRYKGYDLKFVVGYDGATPIGILPLQYNTRTKRTEFLDGEFGNDYCAVWVAPGYEDQVPHFFDQVEGPACFYPVHPDYTYREYVPTHLEPKYILDLAPYTDYLDYLEKVWSKESLRKLRPHIRSFEENEIEIIYNDFNDLELLFDFNIERFGDTSIFWGDSAYKKAYRNLTEHFSCRIMTILVNGKKEACTFGVLHKDRYFGLNKGLNVHVKDLSKMTTLYTIDGLIKEGVAVYDAGAKNFGWKESFHFKPLPQTQLTFEGRGAH